MLGKIIGTTTPTEFTFEVQNEVQNLEYVQVFHDAYEYVLCQVVEIEKKDDETTAKCQVIGYRESGRIKIPRIPFDPGTEVLRAEDQFVAETIEIEEIQRGGHLGKLEGRDIDIFLDLNKVMTKHLSVLAKSGSGKSYTVGVLLEEIIGKGVPVLVVDPHGEYSSLAKKNTNQKELAKLSAQYGYQPESYDVNVWGDPEVVEGAKPLKIPHDFSTQDTVDILPKKPTASQLAILYNAFKQMDSPDLESLIHTIDLEESNVKYQLTTMLEHLKDLDIFTNQDYDYSKFVQPGRCNILNFKGMPPYVQGLVTYKIVKELFERRKKKEIPPFFLVIEEAHNFCPERSFGEKKSSDILRTVASEGRKFGLGLCVISQRPARVDKSVLSQCSTQIIMKITNPNDLRAVSKSVEGITSATEREIQNLQVGSALITGIHDVPLLVNIRPRKTLHGGEAQGIFVSNLRPGDEERDMELLSVIEPTMSYEDILLMVDDGVDIDIRLHPCTAYICGEDERQILMSEVTGEIVTAIDDFTAKRLPTPDIFAEPYLTMLQRIHASDDLVSREDLQNQEAVERLLEEGYLIEENGLLKLSTNFIFSDPKEYASPFQPNYKEVYFDEKLDPEDVDTRSLLDNYVDVISGKMCYVLEYVYE